MAVAAPDSLEEQKETQRQLLQQQQRQHLPALRSRGDSAATAAAAQHCSKCSRAAFCGLLHAHTEHTQLQSEHDGLKFQTVGILLR